MLLWRALRGESENVSRHRPRVSVLVAARNEVNDLPRCLASLQAQDYPEELCEFIIVDDASTDGTAEVIRQWAAQDNRFHPIYLEDTEDRLLGPKKRALAAGIAASKGEIIFTTDADCRAPQKWISTVVSHFGEKINAVCGPVRYEKLRSWWEKLSAFEGLTNSILNAAVIGLGGALSCAGANFAYRREAFIGAGGYDYGERSFSGDDDLLLQRFCATGAQKARYCFHPEARVLTCGPEDRQSYWRRKRRHLSAGKKYAAIWIILAGIIYVGFFLTILLGILRIMGLYHSNLFLLGWGIVSAALLAVFQRGVNRLGERGWFWWSFVASVLFPIIFVLIHPLTLLSSPEWKGRVSSG